MAKPADPTPQVTRLGLPERGLSDLYHLLLSASWTRLMVMVVVTYIVANILFAGLYAVTGGGIENARPGNFADLFFFSVQTMATVGYGKLVPVTFAANAIASTEALLGLLGFAVITGLIFSKFARPTAAVRFSENMVLTHLDGKQALMFRIANERDSHIVEAQLRFLMMKSVLTPEGHALRRILDLALIRSHNSFFSLTWLAIHLIDEHSPLHGMALDQLAGSDILFTASLVGIEELSGQNVHARHRYPASAILPNKRFVDIISLSEEGPTIDYTKFNLVEPSPDTIQSPLGSLAPQALSSVATRS